MVQIKNRLFRKFSMVSTLLFIFCSCSNEIDPIVLKIGYYELRNSNYQYFLLSNKKEVKDKSFEIDIINNGYIMAYAIDNQYDTISFLNKQLEYIERYYASMVEGYVWNKKVKPFLGIDENEIQEAYKKRGVQYEINVIQFPNQEILSKYINYQEKVKTVEEFNALKNLMANDVIVKSFSQSVFFPFYPYGVYLNNNEFFRVDNVAGPIETLNGYILIHVEGVKEKIQQPYEQMRPIIEQELILGLREKYIWESQMEIFNVTNPYFNKKALNTLILGFDKNLKSWPNVDPEIVLMNYDFMDENINYSIRDFMEFVQHQPVFRGDLTNSHDVEKMMKSFLINKYLHQEAQELGMDKDEKFIQFMNMRKQGVYIHHFKKEKILPKLKIQDSEIRNYYINNEKAFISFDEAVISIYKFSDISQAAESRALLVKNPSSHEKSIRNKKLKEEVIKIQMEKQAFNLNFIETVEILNQGEFSYPIQVGKSFCLIKLISKRGKAIIPFSLVHDKIKNQLYKEKEMQILNNELSILSNVYPISINHLSINQSNIY